MRLAAIAFAALCVLACTEKPQPGAACKSGMFCVDAHSALTCQGGVYQPLACHGPRGCIASGQTASCDMQLAEEGETCLGTADTYACSLDHKKGLACRDGRWALWRTCKGPDGCTWKNKSNVECDSTYADVGDPCTGSGNVACGTEKKSLYVCRGDKFEVYKSCRGPLGCTVKDKLADCDDSVAAESDPCDVQEERVCTVDHKAQLVCRASKYVKEKDCKREGGCAFVSRTSPPKCDF